MDRVTQESGDDGPNGPLPRRSPRQGRSAPPDAVEQFSAYRGEGGARPGSGQQGVSPREDYHSAGRRDSSEPLRASWRPRSGRSGDAENARGSGSRIRNALSRWNKTYGWRVYALPILVVVTVLVIVDTASEAGSEGNQGDSVAATGGAGRVPESPAKPANLNIPTAELPQGGEFTQAGKGQWHVVPGTGPKVGTAAKNYTYTVEVEDGIDASSYGGDDAFAKTVQSTLSDPRSWTGSGQASLQRVDASDPDPDFRVSLTTPETNHRPNICGFSIQYESSCYRSSTDRVVINLSRWVRGAKAFSGNMGDYRQYAINHEVGHALGNGHVGCPEANGLAPVMMQQTFGVSNNYVADLNKVDPGNYSAVPADGKTCQPNAWPNPQPVSGP